VFFRSRIITHSTVLYQINYVAAERWPLCIYKLANTKTITGEFDLTCKPEVVVVLSIGAPSIRHASARHHPKPQAFLSYPRHLGPSVQRAEGDQEWLHKDHSPSAFLILNSKSVSQKTYNSLTGIHDDIACLVSFSTSSRSCAITLSLITNLLATLI
jgi:hypothetical protein